MALRGKRRWFRDRLVHGILRISYARAKIHWGLLTIASVDRRLDKSVEFPRRDPALATRGAAELPRVRRCTFRRNSPWGGVLSFAIL